MKGRSVLRALYEEGVRLLFKAYFRLVHRITVEGLHHLPGDHRGLIVIANHASLIDGLILWTYLKMDVTIVVDRRRAREFLFRPFMKNWYTVEIDSMNPFALKGLVERVREGRPLLIFPEGRMTRTGNLMKVYEGTGFVAYKTGARILPVYLGNTYSTIFSRKRSGKRVFPELSMTVFPPRKLPDMEGHPPRRRKAEAAAAVLEMLCTAAYEASNRPSTLGREFVRSCRRNGRKMLYKDAGGSSVTYGRALAAAFALGRCLSRLPQQRVAIFLPTMTVTALLFWALQLFRKTAVFLNYSAGPVAISQGLELADIDAVVTSHQFLERIKVPRELFGERRVIFAEDLRGDVTAADRGWALWRRFFPGSFAAMAEGLEKKTAVVLFTSGSEGVPKGVCLSHENIVANVRQSLARFDVTDEDYFLNVLPMFHSFGLTAGTILPLMAEAKSFLYVSPLHYRIVPEIAYDEGCTIFLATNTFLRGYARKAHPFDFQTVRSIFCGGEKLTDDVFSTYARNFGIRVMAGYGATECSPIVSINTPLEHRYGTVGKPLPGIEHRIVPVEGMDSRGGRVGRLFLRGENLFQGYLRNEEANRRYLVDDGGWYDTGDIVELSEEGFLTIVGRMKRFAKVSGEMISLGAVEEALQRASGERTAIAVLARHDARKGERIVVVTDSPSLGLKGVREALRIEGFTELAVPRELRLIKELPRLGTGKTDYIALARMLDNTKDHT